MIDFSIQLDQNHLPRAELGEADALFNAVILSLHIERGAWFFNPDFGFPRALVKNTTRESVALAKHYAQECLKWIIDAKLAREIEVFVVVPRREWINFRIVLDGVQEVETTLVPWDREPPPFPEFDFTIIDEWPGRFKDVPELIEHENGIRELVYNETGPRSRP